MFPLLRQLLFVSVTGLLHASEPAWVPLSLARAVDGTVTLQWQAREGAWYQVEQSDDLKIWQLLDHATVATAGPKQWSSPSSAQRRFYRVVDWGVFTVSYAGSAFTYADAERTVTGIFIKPAGNGPFPPLVINHGTGGSANGFGLARANEMSPWGLVCIAANLTHAGSQPQDLQTWGYSPENLSRIRACIAVLASRPDVDINRLAMWGHSRGAFATIGATSAIGSRVKAMGASAGGIVEDPGTLEPTLPNVTESSGITAPTILFHGSTDTTVLPETSLRLKTLLDARSVTCRRVVYDTSAITPASGSHNLHQVPAIYGDVLTEWRAWLQTHGVLPP
jgi:dienelactone hydrolase